MTGINKVTEKLRSDAQAEAAAILARAEDDCDAIRQSAEAVARAECEALREASDKECRAIILRARSSAAKAKRDAILSARAALLDEAYASAEKQLRSMTGDRYLDLLIKLLRTALKSRLEEEAESLRLYGEDISPDTYEIMLTDRDRDLYGYRLVEGFASGLGAKLPPDVLGRLVVSDTPAAIDGGLVLRCGRMDINCSLTSLLTENRRATEARVNHILFGED